MFRKETFQPYLSFRQSPKRYNNSWYTWDSFKYNFELFDHSYNCDSFLRMIDFMPYVIRLDFDGRECVKKEEILIVEKEFKGNKK